MPTRICHSNRTPDRGVINPHTNIEEPCDEDEFEYAQAIFKDPSCNSRLLSIGDVVAIKCPMIRDHLRSDFRIKDYLGTVHKLYGGSKYQIVMYNSFGAAIHVDCDLEDLFIR